MKILECIPNFSEGRRPEVLKTIARSITGVPGVTLLHVDSGWTTNRTVMTFVGEPGAVVEAAFQAIKTASELIDMSVHKGEHPRIGATDVCPLVPISGITVEEAVALSNQLAQRVAAELNLRVYLYEYSARSEVRRNLANIRSGEYEALPQRIVSEMWKPDYGAPKFNAKSGATVIGARDFLIAFNLNLNTKEEKLAWQIAHEVRESGKVLKDENGNVITDNDGLPIRQHGKCKAVKAIAWYIPEFGAAQVSLNLVNLDITPVHIAYEAVKASAKHYGLEVTASELIGLIPLKSMLQAGKFYLEKENKNPESASEAEIIAKAVEYLQLNKIKPFYPDERIIEYRMRDNSNFPLARIRTK